MPIPHPLPDAARRARRAALPRHRRADAHPPARPAARGEQSVGELVEALGATQQNVSKHLGVLHQAGIVSRRKDGNRVVYAIADDSVFALCETVCGGLEQQVAEIAQLLEVPAPERSARR